MKITHVYFVKGLSAFYFDDQQAIKDGAQQDGFIYQGQSCTPGFSSVRQAGESVSIMLQLENGNIAIGDCAAVQYSGAGGRDPLFLAESFVAYMDKHLKHLLIGRDVSCFIENARFFDRLVISGQPLHTAIQYGLSQALLEATAVASHRQKVEVLCDEYQLPLRTDPVALFGQSGDDRYNAVDKMILKGVDALPHGLINSIPEKLGRHGEKLQEYVAWLAKRVAQLGKQANGVTYKPDLHIDVYGTVGLIFDNNPAKVADYLASLAQQAGDLNLYIEGPVDLGGKERQIEALRDIKLQLEGISSGVKIVADEWCNTYQDIKDFTDAQCCHMVQVKTPDLGSVHNTIEAVLYANANGMESYQGGTCNETDISARNCVHLALASRPQRMLVKPGMGFDEGMDIVNNEMQRALVLLRNQQQSGEEQVQLRADWA